MPMILRFLQSLLERKLSASTLRVYVAAISARHIKVDGQTVGSHSFAKGAQRRNPPRAVKAPSCDLPLVLGALRLLPFEPLDQAPLKWLSAKVAFLLAIASAKRVSEIHVLSVSEQWHRVGTVA